MHIAEFARPSLKAIHSILRKYNALIVHFSGVPKGGGSPYEYLFPYDLGEVLRGNCQSGLSSSVVMPNDEFANLRCANATGCIGVVLGLQSEHSIVDAHSQDCGTSILDGVRQVPNARDMGIDDIEATVTQRKSNEYNEWAIANYSVIGIFAIEPFLIWKELPVNYPSDMPDWLRTSPTEAGPTKLSIDEIAETFPDHPIYSFVDGVLVHRVSGRWDPISHHQLYP